MRIAARYYEEGPKHVPFVEIYVGSFDTNQDPTYDRAEHYPYYIPLQGIEGEERRAEAVMYAQKICEEKGEIFSIGEIIEEIQRRVEGLKVEEVLEKDIGERRRLPGQKGGTLVGFPPDSRF